MDPRTYCLKGYNPMCVGPLCPVCTICIGFRATTRTSQGPFHGVLMALNSGYLGHIRGQLGGLGSKPLEVQTLSPGDPGSASVSGTRKDDHEGPPVNPKQSTALKGLKPQDSWVISYYFVGFGAIPYTPGLMGHNLLFCRVWGCTHVHTLPLRRTTTVHFMHHTGTSTP